MQTVKMLSSKHRTAGRDGSGTTTTTTAATAAATAEVSHQEMNEMLDTIARFKLTAQKLGVAEEDLLQAMSVVATAVAE